LDALCAAQKGVIVLDEAYVDFANENAMALAKKHPHVLVSRTFSKAYSLCFQRVGYMIGNPALIGAMDKLRDSYNVNGLGQAAAVATLDDFDYYRNNFQRIIATREKFSADLNALGFEVLPSETNFIFAKPPKFPAEQWLEKLRKNNILVRWFRYPATRDYLRITIGTEREMRITLQTIRFLLG
jgi:histidinol-phosphate aminotransferase